MSTPTAASHGSMGGTPSVALRIESLLAEAHACFELLQRTRALLVARGIGIHHLPVDTDLRALALLGDHDRAAAVAPLRGPPWQDLRERNLTRAERPEQVPTPLLRLLSFALPHLSSIATLHEYLSAEALDPPPAGMLRCPSELRAAYWGQPLVLHFSCEQVDVLRIHADEVFGVEPVLLMAQQGRLAGRVSLLADAGQVYFTVQAAGGQRFRHVLQLTLAQSVAEVLA